MEREGLPRLEKNSRYGPVRVDKAVVGRASCHPLLCALQLMRQFPMCHTSVPCTASAVFVSRGCWCECALQ